MDVQRRYLEDACTTVLEATNGDAVFTPDSRKQHEALMLARYPDYGFTLTVALSADALAKELLGAKNYDC